MNTSTNPAYEAQCIPPGTYVKIKENATIDVVIKGNQGYVSGYSDDGLRVINCQEALPYLGQTGIVIDQSAYSHQLHVKMSDGTIVIVMYCSDVDVLKEIDLERLEAHVERCRIQTLEWHSDQIFYELSNSVMKPAWWSVRSKPINESWNSPITRRGLRTILDFIETGFPEFYGYLVATFPKEIVD